MHKRIRCTCYKCGTRKDNGHPSHGEGSFRRTHPTYCRKNTCLSPSSPKYKRKRKGYSGLCVRKTRG